MGSNKCAGICRPQLDESPVPCDMYVFSDCVYGAEGMDLSWLGMSDGDSLTNIFNSMLEELRSQRKRIEELEAIVNNI